MTSRRLLSRLGHAAATAAALTVLAGSLTGAAPTPRTAAAAAHSGGFVDASSVPAEQLRGLDHPVPLREYAAAHGKTAVTRAVPADPDPGEQADLRQQCTTHATAAKTGTGWIKSRFETCQKRSYDLILRNTANTEARGRLWFDMWTLGFAYDGSRRVEYATSIENIRVQAVAGEDATKWRVGQHFHHNINASDSDPDPKVTKPDVAERDELLGVWDRKPLWTLTYTSPDSGPQYASGNQQKVKATIGMDVTASSPSITIKYSEVDAFYSNVRFDYAGPVGGKHKGTVFTQACVELVMSQKDPDVNESALHIYDAQKRPERTFPSWPGKTVPGEKTPLHRLINKDKQEANRDKSIAECKTVWGNYAGTGLECDEYPFASTKEGSTKGDNRFSVRLIDGSDNRKGGLRINDMYGLNRILDGDPFYVKITN